MKHYLAWARLAVIVTCALAGHAHAWKLSPEGSFIEKKLAARTQSFYDKAMAAMALWGIHLIGESVHEEITNRILGCEGDPYLCGSPEYDPEFAYYLAGVRWNDDPPFRFGSGSGDFLGCSKGQTVRFVTQPMCWANTFKDGARRAAKGTRLDGSNATMLVRSHFGDLQFLHAMAVVDEEQPEVTQARIMAWAEFTWRAALGEYDPEETMAALPISGFSDLFSRNKEWRIQDLFALGNERLRSRESISKVAFGSLLHVIQDSFAAGHVERMEAPASKTCSNAPGLSRPGRIMQFHSYPGQDAAQHGHADSRNAFGVHSAQNPSVVVVGRQLLALYKTGAKWEQAAPYLQCLFEVDPFATKAAPGDFRM